LHFSLYVSVEDFGEYYLLSPIYCNCVFIGKGSFPSSSAGRTTVDKDMLVGLGVDILAEDRKANVSTLLAKQQAEVDSTPMSALHIKSLESIIGKAIRRSSPVRWIVNGLAVSLTVPEAQTMADNASDFIEEIYFRYEPLINAAKIA